MTSKTTHRLWLRRVVISDSDAWRNRRTECGAGIGL